MARRVRMSVMSASSIVSTLEIPADKIFRSDQQG